MMNPIEGMDYVLVLYKQVFLISGIIGILITVAGIILWKKRK
jgi:LPXTG-motif cell wall-anchored protein